MSGVRITQGQSELGRWEIAAAPADPQLAGVRGYVGLASELAITAERHLPSGEAAIVVNLGAPYEVTGPTGALRVGRAAVMGVHALPFRTFCSGRKSLLLVRLAPPAAQRLLGRPMTALAGRWAPLEEFDARLAQALTDVSMRRTDWADRFNGVDDVLGTRLGRLDPTAAATTWEAIRAAGGRGRIADLARVTGLTHRRFASDFRAAVGVGPKTAARLARFNRVLRGMGPAGAVPGADAAAEHGYFDQAHMIAEFRAFALATPTAVLRSAAAFTLRA